MPLGLSLQRLPVDSLQWVNNSGIRWRTENDFGELELAVLRADEF